jgi:hypothetical protein
MISKPTRTWARLSRTLDTLLETLSDDDLGDLFVKVERERTRRFLVSQGQPCCPACGFAACQCFPE